MSLSKEDLHLIERHFDRLLNQNEKEAFNLKYLASGEFKNEVDLRKNLINNVEELREDDLRKQFTSHMHSMDDKKKERIVIRKKLFAAASFLLILSSIGIYFTFDNTKSHQELFNEYYTTYDGIAHSRNQTDQLSEGRINYLNGNYEAALLPLLRLEEHAISDLLMIGICYLETNQPALALNWFSKIEVVGAKDVLSVRDWYIALAYLKNGQLDKCEETLMSKTITNSIYSKRSKALLNEDLFDD